VLSAERERVQLPSVAWRTGYSARLKNFASFLCVSACLFVLFMQKGARRITCAFSGNCVP
jgi:hypothetical protein